MDYMNTNIEREFGWDDTIQKDNDFIVLHRKYLKYNALRLELGENGESHNDGQYRAEPTG